jgi:stage III sporulation protein AC
MELDITILFKIAGIGLVVAFLHTLLEQVGKKEYAQWVTFFGFLYILYLVVRTIDHFFKELRSIFF